MRGRVETQEVYVCAIGFDLYRRRGRPDGGVRCWPTGRKPDVLTGTVTDASGQALPGVMVTLTGDRGTTEQVTDENGTYRFALVPPGDYKVTASLEGFRPTEGNGRDDGGRKGRARRSRCRLETAEEITVTSEAPMVDKFNVTAGGSVEAETVLEAAPVNRGIYGPINFLPGVTNDNESLDLSSSRPTVNGASWIESAVFVDGVDTTFARYGATRTLLPTTSTTEITMEAGGQTADFGRVVGSHVNVITKSGTNNWHGEGNVVYEDLNIDRNYDPQPILETKPITLARPSRLRRLDRRGARERRRDHLRDRLRRPHLPRQGVVLRRRREVDDVLHRQHRKRRHHRQLDRRPTLTSPSSTSSPPRSTAWR